MTNLCGAERFPGHYNIIPLKKTGKQEEPSVIPHHRYLINSPIYLYNIQVKYTEY